MTRATTISAVPTVPFRQFVWPERKVPRVVELNGYYYERQDEMPRTERRPPAGLLSSTDIGILLDIEMQEYVQTYKRVRTDARHLPFTFALAARHAGFV